MSNKFNILILGDGFICSYLYRYFLKLKINTFVASHSSKNNYAFKIDDNLKDIFNEVRPTVLINTTSVSSYQNQNKSLFKRINYDFFDLTLILAKKFNCKYIFFSSSYVFSGKKGNYRETDFPDSSINYSLSKLYAEKKLVKYRNSIIVRCDTVYGQCHITGKIRVGTNLLENLIVNFPEVIRKPICVNDIPKILIKLIHKDYVGIINIAGTKKYSLKKL